MNEKILISREHKAVLELVNCDAPLTQGTLNILKSILNLYTKYFPKLRSADLTIRIDPLYPNPYCQYTTKTIYLKTMPLRWAQLAYQCFHELCHFVIFDESASRVLWFEESLAEMSSYFFLNELSLYCQKYYSQLQTADGTAYYKYFKEYQMDDMKKAIPFDIANLKNDQNILNKLEETGENRELNAHIAITLLPIFERTSDLWTAIPLISEINTNNYQELLKEWYKISPKYLKKGVKEILDVFNIVPD